MKISIAIVDSDMRQRNATAVLLGDYISKRHLDDISMSGFRSGIELLSAVRENGRYDVYILETGMPDMNGILIARELRAISAAGRVIYCTTDSSYALQAFDVRAFHYLMKPLKEERMYAALDELLEIMEREVERAMIEIKTAEGFIRLALEDLTHVNIVDRMLCYHLKDGTDRRTLKMRGNFRDAVSELLEQPSYFIAGASLVINLNFIHVVSREAVLLTNGVRLTPPKASYKSLHRAWKRFNDMK